VAELTAVGKPAILVPLPQAIYQHQARNAAVLEQAGAAMVLPQAGLSGAALGKAIVGLLTDGERLRAMGDRSRSLGRTDSAAAIIRECLALVGRGRWEVRAGG
jgi:UDP-N-acetylglucosamine--N-acetylmuramyl-(pentapeptide) pyrophosphoryl-undecaprenol N-acetylglucosamine transferase